MDINVMQLIVIIVLCGLAWWANNQLNNIPVLKNVVNVLIVVVGVLLVLRSLGVMDSNSMHVRV